MREQQLYINRVEVEEVFQKRLNLDQQTLLQNEVTMEKIKEAMFSIHDDKASSPDDYNSVFFKRAWSIVGGRSYPILFLVWSATKGGGLYCGFADSKSA